MGEEGADVLEILPASGENLLDTLERRERDLLLSAALHRLPGPDRTLIRQLYWDGLPRDRDCPAGRGQRRGNPQTGAAYPQIPAFRLAGSPVDPSAAAQTKMQIILPVCGSVPQKVVQMDYFFVFATSLASWAFVPPRACPNVSRA